MTTVDLLAILCVSALALVALVASIAWWRARAETLRLRGALTAAGETKKTQDSLLSQRSELDTIKDEFISTVSHELRTPLTSIRGALGLLSAGLMGDVDAKAQNLLRIAVTNTDRLIRLINDILDLERMQSGRAPLYIRRCSLRELAQQALETMTPMADSAQVRLKCTAPELTPSHPDTLLFDGDPDRILQILTNLLSNAIKFSPAQSVVHIEVEAAPNDRLELRVRDQGRGIPQDKLESIFDRFGQVEASDARQKGGTGLGLAICRTIAQQHHGTIWAESNGSQSGPPHGPSTAHRNPGTTFVVSLPRLSHVPEAVFRAETPLPSSAEGSVLLCDDDEGIRTIVCEHLERRGYTVVQASSGEQAIQLAGQHSFSAILLDLYMPGLTGWETLQRLKHSPATASIPVVILSVLAPMRRAGERVDDITPQGWVQKPFNESVLLAELSRVLHTGDGPAHVLLVEDDHDLAAVVIASFEDANVRIDHASTRSEAIEHCRLARPDLLILDLTLPDGDGFSLVDWLRRQPELRTLPLVVYSGREVSDTEMGQLRLGPTQFLTKAKVQPEEVEELVFKMVQTLRLTPANGVPAPLAQPDQRAGLASDQRPDHMPDERPERTADHPRGQMPGAVSLRRPQDPESRITP